MDQAELSNQAKNQKTPPMRTETKKTSELAQKTNSDSDGVLEGIQLDFMSIGHVHPHVDMWFPTEIPDE